MVSLFERCVRENTFNILLAGLFFALISPMTEAKLFFEWSEDYSADERAATKNWVTRYHQTIENTFGPYPFDIRIGFHRRGKKSTHLDIFGMTDRSDQQGIDFYIDSPHAVTLSMLMDEWTAAHELSHLLIPYVGQKHTWFAEGFASYMQYKVMADSGQISEVERWNKYQWHINKASGRYAYGEAPFIDMVSSMRKNWDWPMIHWGGVSYFINAEYALNKKNTSIEAVVSNFMVCCRENNSNLRSLLAEFDRLSNSTIFTDLYQQMKSQPGFPNYRAALNKLSPPKP
jgi:hypothetical protein